MNPIVKAICDEPHRIREVVRQNAELVNCLDPELGVAPLHFAAQVGDSSAIRALLEHEAHLEIRNRAGDTPLILAAREGHSEAAQLLCEVGADVDAHNAKGISALAHATISKEPSASQCVALLKARGARVDLLVAIYSGDIEQIRELAAERHGDAVAQRLRERSVADLISSWQLQASNATSYSEHKSELETICEQQSKLLDLLLENGAHIDAPGTIASQPALVLALSDSWAGTTFAKLLLSRGASPNVNDRTGRTPLEYAISLGNEEAAALLRSSGAKIGQTNAVYDSVIARLRVLGIRAEFHRPHQLVLPSRVWITFNGHWFISTWAPDVYPVPAEVDIVELCEACVKAVKVDDSPYYEIPPDICARFGISRMALEDFERVCLIPPDDDLDEEE